MIDTLHLYGLPPELPKVGLFGLSRTGKGTAANLLRQEFGFTTFTMSDIIRRYAAENRIELKTRPDFWATRNRINSELGMDYLKDEALRELGQRYQANPYQVKGVVMDGLRSVYDAEKLNDLPGMLLLALISDDNIRHQRKRPDRPEDDIHFEQFLADEADERAVIEHMYPLAWGIINNGLEAHFRKLLRTTIMTQFGVSRIPPLNIFS